MNKEYALELPQILELLLHTHAISDSALSKKAGVPQPTIHRLRSGMSPDPRVSTLIPLANYFNITVGQLIGTETLPNDLNQPHNNSTGVTPFIPTLSWQDVSRTKQQTLYALKIEQNFKKNSALNFGTIITVDPHKAPQDRDFVIVKKQGQQSASVMIWIEQGGACYLAPLHDELPTTLFDATDTLCGVIIEIRNFNPKA